MPTLPLWLPPLPVRLHGARRPALPLLLAPFQPPHLLVLRDVALHAVRRGAARSAQSPDEGFGFLDIVEAHELAPQFETAVLDMNTATILFQARVQLKAVQELLGHSTIATTADIYPQVSSEMREEVVN